PRRDPRRAHAVHQQAGADMVQDVSPDGRAMAEHGATLTPLRGMDDLRMLGRGRWAPASSRLATVLALSWRPPEWASPARPWCRTCARLPPGSRGAAAAAAYGTGSGDGP